MLLITEHHQNLEKKMGDEKLPGLRFYPTEEELVSFYLHNKLEAANLSQSQLINQLVIPDLHLYDFNPWDLPEVSGELCRGDPEQWFFFIPRQERGGRPNRMTSWGYWKATGSPSYVYSSDNRTIGLKRTMVYYTGRAPSGTKTLWKMNEYKAIIQPTHHAAPTVNTPNPMLRQEYSLCRVYKQPKTMRAFDRRPTIAANNYPLITTTLPLPPPLDHARPVTLSSFDDNTSTFIHDHLIPTPLNNYQVADFNDEDGSSIMDDWDLLLL